MNIRTKHMFDLRTERCLACDCDRANAPENCGQLIRYREWLYLRGSAAIWWRIPRLMPLVLK